MKFFRNLLFPLIALLPLSSFAQCDTIALAPDEMQHVFCKSSGRGDVFAVEKYNDTLYVGGNFDFVGTYTGRFIGVDTATGALYNQPTWPKVNGTVLASISDGNGGMIIAGEFTKVGNVTRNYLAHISSSGQITSLSHNFSSFSTVNVQALLLHNGILYVGGRFNNVNSSSRNSIAAFNFSTGSLTSWNPNVSGTVKSLATDGTNIYVGGDYSAIGSTSYDDIAAVSISTGNVVTTWTPSLSTYTPGIEKILVNGNVMYLCGGMNNRIAKVHIPTATVMSWNNYPNTSVHDMLLADKKLYIAGDFTSVGGQSRKGLAVFDTTSGNLLSWDPQVTGGQVFSIALQGNKIFAGGDFNTVSNAQRRILAAIDTGTTVVNNLQLKPNLSCKIYTLLPVGDKLYVGGNFQTLDGVARDNIAAINLKTNKVHSFNHTIENASSEVVYALKAENNILHIGGLFKKIDNDTANSYAMLNLAADTVITTEPMLGESYAGIRTIEIHGSYVYLGGAMTINNNGTHKGILRFNKSTYAIDSWAPVMYLSGSNVRDVAIANNSIYIVGEDIYNAASGNSMLMKTNLTTGSSQYLANGSSFDHAYAVCIFGDKVYVGGDFSKIDNVTRSALAAFDTGSLSITSYSPLSSTSPVMSITSYKNKLIITGQQFSQGYGSYPPFRKGIAVLDTVSGTMQNAWKPSVSFSAEGAYITGDTLFAFGSIYSVDNNSLAGMARFHLDAQTPTASISSPATICANTNTTFTVNTTVSGGSYQWKRNGSNVGTNATTYSYIPSNGDIISCTVTIPNTSANCFLADNKVVATDTVDVTANVIPTASITATDDTVCDGTKVHFSVSTNITGATYQWKIGSTNTGANKDTFSYFPNNGQVVSCVITKAAGTCFSPSSVTVDTTMVVNNNIVPSISITDTASANVCPGSIDSFTATTNITGATYQWKVNNTNSGTNSDAYKYTPANNDQVYCIITMPAGCFTKDKDTSNTITVNHLTPTVPSVSISESVNNVCVGTQVNFTAAANITGAAYQWRLNGTNTGTNTATLSTTPANNDKVACVITAPVGCYIPDTAVSNNITMIVNQKATPTISISGPASAGEFATVNLSANLSGAGSTYSIVWKNNGNTFATTSNTTTSYVKAKGTDNIVATITPTGCYNNATSNTLIITEAVGVENILGDDNVKVFPNPFSSHVTISGLQPGDKIMVYDMLSRIVFSADNNGKHQAATYDFDELAQGIYIMTVTSSEGAAKKQVKLQKK